MKTHIHLTFLAIGLSLLFGASARAADEPHSHTGTAIAAALPDTPQGLWARINADSQRLAETVKARTLKDVHPLTESLSALVQLLPAKSMELPAEKQARIAGQAKNAAKALESLHVAADADQQADAEARLKAFSGVLALLKAQYPESVAAAVAPVSSEGHEHGTTGKVTMKAEIIPQTPVAAGSEIAAMLRLTRPDGRPATLADLAEVHTKKIHLLIIDTSLGDYHHEHPTETAIPGEFAFTFRPRNGGTYTAWADLLPLATGRQEYAKTEIAVTGEPKALDQSTNLSAVVDGYRFALSTENDQPIRTGEATLVSVKVTKPDGTPANNLEPLMGAFAHGVGFTADLGHVLHVHPMGDEPQKETERGGPDLQFHLAPERAGFQKFYVQVRIDGKERFAGFGLQVAEGDAPAKLVVNNAALTVADRQLLAGYENIRIALAADDLAAAKQAAARLPQAAAIAQSKTIAAAREAFKPLSADAVKLAAGKPGFYVMRCPMVKQGDWVQTNDRVDNPYMGKRMLSCGALIQ